MEEQKNKMQDSHWFQLYLAAAFFDFCGWVCLLLDIVLVGWAGFLLNLFAGMTFLLWAFIWTNKGLGVKFFITLGLSFLVEVIPLVGDILPTWTFMVYRAKLNYERGSTITGAVSGQLKQKIGGSKLSERQKYWATKATEYVSEDSPKKQSRTRTLNPSENTMPKTQNATAPLVA